MSKNNQSPHNEEQGPDTGLEEIGEGGPLERERSFIAQRFGVLQPREAPPGEPAVLPHPGIPFSTSEEEAEAGPLPPDFRQKLMEKYRQRQRSAAPPTGPVAFGEPPPPEAPSPPPANNWVPVGPCVVRQGQASNRPAVSGRVAGLAVAPSASRIYAASANGGVWRSDDGGMTWHSTMEAWDLNPTARQSDSLACGAIVIHPTNPNRVYVGTGEGVGAANSYFGVGPIRSDDGGNNWITEPASPSLLGSGFYRLAVDPGNPEYVVGATRRGLYRREPDGGGGWHWMQKLAGRFTSVVTARSGGVTTFYAARWGGGVLSSADGDAWAGVGAGFPSANVGRIGLAVQPNNPNVVYTLIHNNNDNYLLGVWRLDTSDNTWRQISGAPADLFGSAPMSGQGWYDLAIVVDPNNVNRIYLGGSTVKAGGLWAGSLYRCAVAVTTSGGTITGVSTTNTYIGATVHADIHALEFTPGNPDELWAGCDGGVFFTDGATGSASFEARNVGLACLTMNHLAQHPTEDAVVFCGTQDNGTTRYTGEEVWLHSASGDGGFVVINWNDPYKVLRTYVRGKIYRAADGGQGYGSWSWAGLPAAHINNAQFYAPLVGTPRNTAAPSEAEIVAFGGQRPWVSNDFGSTWQSIPNNSNSDDLPNNILSLAFASATRLYAGTISDDVYRFDKNGATWSRTKIDTAGGVNVLPLAGPVTDIAVDLADASGDAIYITFGGTGDYRHVWHFDGTGWAQRSGSAAGAADSLLDVQFNAIVVDPSHTDHLYAGADIGVWRSTDGGATWSVFSEGLPDAAVLDLKLHNGRRLLRVSTHGRGVYERTLDTTTARGVELYVRDTQLDLGRRPTVNGLDDPTWPGETVGHWKGPDIKVDVPNVMNSYQTPTPQIDCYQFVDTIVDGSGGVASMDPGVDTVTNRVYVQVHNRGVTPANNVRVMLLLTSASAGLPDLPPGYETNVQTGTAISTPHWQTVGTKTLNNLQVGLPQIAYFNLLSSMLPPPASLTGNAHHCLLALLHCPDDEFTSTETHVDTLSPTERKAAHKNLHVVEFSRSAPFPIITALRLYGLLDRELVSDFIMNLHDWPIHFRLFIPDDLQLVHALEQSLDGFHLEDPVGVDEWAGEKIEQLHHQMNRRLFNPLWCEEMIKAIHKVRGQRVLVAETSKKPVSLNSLVIPPETFYTVFLAIDRPDARIGDRFYLTAHQRDVERRTILGGSTYLIQFVPEPDVEEKLRLRVWGRRWWFRGYEVAYVRVMTEDGKILGSDDGAEVGLYMHGPQGIHKELWPMRYHRGWRAFWLRVDQLPHLRPGVVKVTAVARVKDMEARKTEVIRF